MSTDSYRFRVGTIQCTVVSDGTFAYPNPARLFFANAAIEPLEQALRSQDVQPEEWAQHVSPYDCLVINTGQHRVLVDTGADGLAPTTGELVRVLEAEGFRPQDIDVVIITHAHPDHIGGVCDSQGKLTFPNARYLVSRAEWEFWTSEPDLAGLPVDDHLKEMLRTIARDKLVSIRGQLDLIDREAEIVPGVRALAAPGHTPGHMAVEVSSGGEKLLYAADTVIHPIHLEHPDWYAATDCLPDETVATRRRLLDLAANEGALVLAFHFPFPGLGRVARNGAGWEWRPVDIRKEG